MWSGITRGGGPFDRTPDVTCKNSSLARCAGVAAIVGFESLGLLAVRFGRIVSAAGPMGEAREPSARRSLF